MTDSSLHLIKNDNDQDLSEDFLSKILKQVDEMCDTINNEDPNLQRTLEINQNLNNAVNCYRKMYNEIFESEIEHFETVESKDEQFEKVETKNELIETTEEKYETIEKVESKNDNVFGCETEINSNS